MLAAAALFGRGRFALGDRLEHRPRFVQPALLHDRLLGQRDPDRVAYHALVVGVGRDVQVVRLLHIVLDRLLRRPIELAEIADRFRHLPRQVALVRDVDDAPLGRGGRLVRVQPLVVHLQHRAGLDRLLQLLGHDVLVELVVAADRLTDALYARPLLLEPDAPDRLQDPLFPYLRAHVIGIFTHFPRQLLPHTAHTCRHTQLGGGGGDEKVERKKGIVSLLRRKINAATQVHPEDGVVC